MSATASRQVALGFAGIEDTGVTGGELEAESADVGHGRACRGVKDIDEECDIGGWESVRDPADARGREGEYRSGRASAPGWIDEGFER